MVDASSQKTLSRSITQGGGVMAIIRPVLRYPGGKYLMAKWIVSHFPSHNLFVEAFGGAASVLLAKQRSNGEIYNDLNGDVVNVFRVLRDPTSSKHLQKLLRLTPFSIDEYKSCYEPVNEPIEKARRMIFRSFAGIGSDSVFQNNGFRYSKHNKSGTVPAQGWMRFPDAINSFTKRLQGVLINNLDALDIIQKYDGTDTLFYLDPPYLGSTRSTESVRYDHEMLGSISHELLAELLHSIKGMIILSGYTSPLYEKLYPDWRVMKKVSKSQIGSKRVECLWLSPNIQTTLF